MIIGTGTNRAENENFILWDYWLKNDVNIFDTSYHYNEGEQEIILGKWIEKRQIQDKVAIISKNTLDENINDSINKLKTSLDRLKIKKVDFFFFHRVLDKINIKDYLEICNKMVSLNLISHFGFSNISFQQLKNLNNFLNSSKEIFISNNLSYAKMMKAPWKGVFSCRDEQFIEFLNLKKITNFSWSSQAMGYFYKKFNQNFIFSKFYYKFICKEKSKRVFSSYINSKNFKKLSKLSLLKKESQEILSLSWVLNQKFPSFAIVNCNSKSQIDEVIKATKIKIINEEMLLLK